MVFTIKNSTGFSVKLIAGLFLFSLQIMMGQTDLHPKDLSIETETSKNRLSRWQKELDKLEQTSKWPEVVEQLKNYSRYYIEQRVKDSALIYLTKALQISNEHKTRQQAEILADMGFVYNRFGDQVKGLEYGIKSVVEAEKQSLPPMVMGDIYNKLSISYSTILDYDKAVMYSKKAIKALEKTNNLDLILSSYFNLAITLPDMDKDAEGLQLLEEIQKKYPSEDAAYQFVINYIYTNIYLKNNKTALADTHFKKLMELPEEVRMSPEFRNLFLYTAVNYYTTRKEFGKAKPYLEIRAEMLKQNFDLQTITKNEEFLFMADSTQGDYFNALKHYQQFDKWKDSLFTLNKQKQLEELNLKFETGKKDREIVDLKQKDEIRKVQLRQAHTVRYIFIGGILVLFVIVGLLYYAYHTKKISNRELQGKQQEINRQNLVLQQLVQDKEWLLKEIHHRVKNNLQIVISLLNSQSAYLDNEAALQALQNSQHRMHAMSLIHQKLYMSDNLATINIEWYINELLKYIKDCLEHNKLHITYDISVLPEELDVSQAVPVGLIINEAVVNAIKYAFPDVTHGKITVTFREKDAENYQLIIADNGKGLPEDFELRTRQSLGTNLMKGLANQLEGTLEMANNQGLCITITFLKGNTKL